MDFLLTLFPRECWEHLLTWNWTQCGDVTCFPQWVCSGDTERIKSFSTVGLALMQGVWDHRDLRLRDLECPPQGHTASNYRDLRSLCLMSKPPGSQLSLCLSYSQVHKMQVLRNCQGHGSHREVSLSFFQGRTCHGRESKVGVKASHRCLGLCLSL